MKAIVLLTTLSGFVVAAPARPKTDSEQRLALVWLYDCSEATLKALQNKTDSFNAVSPSLYTVGVDADGDATLSGDASSCVQSVKRILPGVAIWPWITSPDGLKSDDEVKLMRTLFSRPSKFLARALDEELDTEGELL